MNFQRNRDTSKYPVLN